MDRAAELVNSKGKEAFSEFRQRESEWFSGDTYIFAYAPDGTVVLNPAFPWYAAAPRISRTKGQEGKSFPRRDFKDRADKRIRMGGLLATEARDRCNCHKSGVTLRP